MKNFVKAVFNGLTIGLVGGTMTMLGLIGMIFGFIVMLGADGCKAEEIVDMFRKED